jgi:THO complex subunit 2
MAGIEPVENLSESQITALTYGPTVAIEALASSTRGALQTRPLDRPTEKLMTALVKNDLAVPLLILLAQHRQSYVFRTHNASLKTLSSLYDEVRSKRCFKGTSLSLLQAQSTFFQYMEFLTYPISKPIRGNLPVLRESFLASLPSLETLVKDFSLEPAIVMHLYRPHLRQLIKEQALVAEAEAEKKRVSTAKIQDVKPPTIESSADTEARLRAQMMANREPSAPAAPTHNEPESQITADASASQVVREVQ